MYRVPSWLQIDDVYFFLSLLNLAADINPRIRMEKIALAYALSPIHCKTISAKGNIERGNQQSTIL